MMDIDKMDAGREMDALVAERVMGWTRIHRLNQTGDFCGVPPQGAPPYVLPYYSTDIAAAWQVVDEMAKRSFTIYPLLRDAGQWMARFVTDDDPCGLPLEAGFIGYGDTAPLAICRAALKVMEAKGKQTMSIDEMLSWA